MTTLALGAATLGRRFLASGDERDLPIVDAHLHFWNPRINYHPWLCDEPMIPFRYGDYSQIRKPFLPPDYQAQKGAHQVIGCVYMEAEWQPGDAEGEARWIHQLNDITGWPNAMIGQAWLDRADIEEQLTRLRAWPLIRGIRHKPASLPREAYRPDHALPGSMACPRWQRGVRAVARHGLILELQTPWWHLHELTPLLARHPDMPVVINHAGVPGDRAPDTLDGWQRALRLVAVWPNVMLKLSGLGLEGAPWRIEDNREVVHAALDIMGPARCMFASNFPVDGLVTKLDTLFDAFKTLTAGLTRDERMAVFCDNTMRCYRLHESPADIPDTAIDPGSHSRPKHQQERTSR